MTSILEEPSHLQVDDLRADGTIPTSPQSILEAVPWCDDQPEGGPCIIYDDEPDYLGIKRFPQHGVMRIAFGCSANQVDKTLEKGGYSDETDGAGWVCVTPDRAMKIAIAIIKQANALREEM